MTKKNGSAGLLRQGDFIMTLPDDDDDDGADLGELEEKLVDSDGSDSETGGMGGFSMASDDDDDNDNDNDDDNDNVNDDDSGIERKEENVKVSVGDKAKVKKHKSHKKAVGFVFEVDGKEGKGKGSASEAAQRPRVVRNRRRAGVCKFFDELNLSRPLLRAVKELGWTAPTPVQSEAIPRALTGADLLVNAETGSGKTAAFVLPILERLLYRSRREAASRALILCPTRELATQCYDMAMRLAVHTDVHMALVVGGLSMKAQETTLRSRPDVVIATPGRMIDHLRNTQTVHLEEVEILVLDEADRLLELGFMAEMKELVRFCPRGRQTMLFSATLSKGVSQLVDLSLNQPHRISVDPVDAVVQTLCQEFVRIRPNRESDREAIVFALCTRTFKKNVIVFLRSKTHAHRMKTMMDLIGLRAAELHGNLTQLQRLGALQQFRDNEVDFLICTDLAARGLDIRGVKTVINMHMPNMIEQYIHRVGRTARAGRAGTSVTLLGESRRKMLRKVVAQAREMVRSRTVPSEVIEKQKETISGLQRRLRAVMQRERLEKEARLAEIEANKVANVLLYEREIMSRPRRTWFQNEQEKRSQRELGADLFMNDEARARKKRDIESAEKERLRAEKKRKRKDPLRGLKRREKRRKMMRMEVEAEQAAQKQRSRDGESAGFTSQQRAARAARVEKSKRRGVRDRDEVQSNAANVGMSAKRISDDLEADVAFAMAAERRMRVSQKRSGNGSSLSQEQQLNKIKKKKKKKKRYNEVGLDHDADSFVARYASSDRSKKLSEGFSKKPKTNKQKSFKSLRKYKRR